MTLTIIDANGNDVAGMAKCTRCGSPIKHVFTFEGQPYGSTCIEAVSGIRPSDWVEGSEKKTRESLAKAEDDRKNRAAQEAELARIREANRAANRAKFFELINVLNNASKHQGDFCSEMAANISNDGFDTVLFEGILSPRQFQIVREIWGKQTGGRMNSKAYKAAVSEFDAKFDNESELK